MPGPAPAAYPALRLALGGTGAPRGVDHLRRALNWLNLSTPLGLLVARAGGARLYRGPRGHYLADGYTPRLPAAPAFAIGDVLVSRRPWPDRIEDRPELLAHEAAHSWQYVATLGLPFVPLYLLATGWSWLRTGDRGTRNVFEQWAGLRRGGYAVDVPTWTLTEARRAAGGFLARRRRD